MPRRPGTGDSQTVPPNVRPQFFYASSLPIDDPLSPLPQITSSTNRDISKLPPQPFSAKDNAALEEAWQSLQVGSDDEDEDYGSEVEMRVGRNDARPRTSHSAKSITRKRTRSRRKSSSRAIGSRPSTARSHENPHVTLADEEQRSDEDIPVDKKELGMVRSKKRMRSGSDLQEPGSKKRNDEDIMDNEGQESAMINVGLTAADVQASNMDDTFISGRPFARAPSRPDVSKYKKKSSTTSLTKAADRPRPMFARFDTNKAVASAARTLSRATLEDDTEESEDEEEAKAFVPVGVSRLHLVELPSLQMKPIYWSPVHDIASVIRATWFYKETMLPVEPDLANQLEAGYEYMRPWTETWQDELNSCVENGAEAELKVVHRLWPEDEQRPSTSRSTATDRGKIDGEMMTGASGDDGSDQDVQVNMAAAGDGAQIQAPKPFKTSSVIYVDEVNAQILRPNLLPSPSRGRRPLGPIRKGRPIGIAIVRGFDAEAWERLHPSKATPQKRKAQAAAPQSGDATTASSHPECPACKADSEKPPVSDLVFVIHGIGQKLSERVESFHFTHAINAFRRSVNLQLNEDAVKNHLQPDLGGLMVLPINWRHTLSLEDGDGDNETGAKKGQDAADNHFGLKDITPPSLPAVRSLINDVVLDIPFYLSHHRSKMVQAVVKEANRVYRLWCRNNPGFHEKGRVHLIAHSLGSVMAVDILSQQPTSVPRHLDLETDMLNEKTFDFDTKNLFMCGSPSGWFLLLNRGKSSGIVCVNPANISIKATLLPRKGRNKPGCEGEDIGRGIAGQAGRYGCLAVDNLYNIIHYNDRKFAPNKMQAVSNIPFRSNRTTRQRRRRRRLCRQPQTCHDPFQQRFILPIPLLRFRLRL